jgi:transcriptional regulator with XRE-family HTH domain
MARPSSSHAYSPNLLRLGATIRRIRKARGLSQEQLALISGIDRSYMGGVERGEHNIAIVNLLKIARSLETSLELLFGEACL